MESFVIPDKYLAYLGYIPKFDSSNIGIDPVVINKPVVIFKSKYPKDRYNIWFPFENIIYNNSKISKFEKNKDWWGLYTKLYSLVFMDCFDIFNIEY